MEGRESTKEKEGTSRDKEEEEVENIYHDTMKETEEEDSRDKEEEEGEDIYPDTMEGRESTKKEEGEPEDNLEERKGEGTQGSKEMKGRERKPE